jgi:hypothetical protein
MKPHVLGYIIFMMNHLKNANEFDAWLKREGYGEGEVAHIHRTIEDQQDVFRPIKYGSMV